MSDIAPLKIGPTGLVILPVPGHAPAPREAPAPGEPPAPGAPPVPPQSTGDAVRMLAGHWDALARALAVAPRLENIVPRPGPEMAALALALVGALKRGTLADWIGHEDSRALPAPLADRLGEDFTRMARLAAAEPGAWRFIPIPLLHQDQLGQALAFVRGGQRHDGAPDDDGGTRILVEIEPPRLGRMQIDALVRPRRFDAIVRSHGELPPALRARLAAVHDEACAIARLTGAIGFQPGASFVAPPLAADTFGVTA